MDPAIFVRLALTLPPDAMRAFQRSRLLAEDGRLHAVPGFDNIAMGDDDLLGAEVTVRDAANLDEALRALDSMAFPIDRKRISRWERRDEGGRSSVTLEEAGPLPRSADVGDLLAYVRRVSDEGQCFWEVRVDETAGEVAVRGLLPTYDEYREHRLPFVYLIASAGSRGGQGELTFLGDADGEFVALFVDVHGESTEISEPDPQNLVEDDWEARLGGVESLTSAHAAWSKRAKKATRKRGG